MRNDADQSIQIASDVVESFISNHEFPFLISFPRTGSHWLRMMMELYFERPSLVRAFYYKDATSFTCYHRHDEELNIERKNVIYLYRKPIDTIYSQMSYYKEDLENIDRVRYWANLYGSHLQKWLIDEAFTKRKTILKYERLRNNVAKEFIKICEHFEANFNLEKLLQVADRVTKNEVKSRTSHDPQVIDDSAEYDLHRSLFASRHATFIHDRIISVDGKLEQLL